MKDLTYEKLSAERLRDFLFQRFVVQRFHDEKANPLQFLLADESRPTFKRNPLLTVDHVKVA